MLSSSKHKEKNMENVTFAEIAAVVLAIASAIVLLANAAGAIVKAWKAAKAPNDKQNDRLDALEEWRKEVDGKLNSDHSHLTSIDSGNRVMQRALLALLDHGIDGNNIKQMQDAKEDLQDHLINR
jgi:hypothetical protein